jgi:hypothetical protein
MIQIQDIIKKHSVLPPRYNLMLEQALVAVADDQEREELAVVSSVVSSATWKQWQLWRSHEDGGKRHEWIVFANMLKIAESEKLTREEKRIATAFCFTHDSVFIKRIMEDDIFKKREQGLHAEADEMERLKSEQRNLHMQGGAENADFMLNRLKHPDNAASPLFTQAEVDRCVEIIAIHDKWKLDTPAPPPTEDKLAVTCVEADALWPLHPIGVLTDIERPTVGVSKDFSNPTEWRDNIKQSLRTLLSYQDKWIKQGIAKEDFRDDDSIFRTREGHRLYSEWRELWAL